MQSSGDLAEALYSVANRLADCWIWVDQEEDMKEAEGCCIERAIESDYIHNQDE
jgi:hypothetical protein